MGPKYSSIGSGLYMADDIPPGGCPDPISELLDAADNAYTVQEFKDTERFVLNVLQWKVGDTQGTG